MVAKRNSKGKAVTLTQEEFLKRCSRWYVNVYDYSKVSYQGGDLDIIVGCPLHGWFTVKANKHSGGVSDCPTCMDIAKKKRRQQKEYMKFLAKAKKVHGNKYNYDKVVYIKSSLDVIITCQVHGDFPQTPANHTSGSGCRDCGKETATRKLQLSPATIRERSFEKFGVVFDFDFTGYVNVNSKINICCPVHGWQIDKVSRHLASEDGCSLCFDAKDKIAWNRLSVEENMKILLELYGDSYHFFSEDINISENKVRFWCYRHNRFHSTKLGHLRYGYACPDCGNETKPGFYTRTLMEREKEHYLQDPNNIYIFKLEDGLHKIGIAKMPNARNSQVKNQSGYEESEVVYTKIGSTYDCFYLEQELHEDLKVSRKVFDYKWAGYTEVFCIDEVVVQDVIHKIEGVL